MIFIWVLFCLFLLLSVRSAYRTLYGQCRVPKARIRKHGVPEPAFNVQRFLEHPFLDPFTGKRMCHPVLAMDGITYEWESIVKWFRTNDTSPLFGNVMGRTLIPNITLGEKIRKDTNTEVSCYYGSDSEIVFDLPVIRIYNGETYEKEQLDAELNEYYSNDPPSMFGVDLYGLQYVSNVGLGMQIVRFLKNNPNGIHT